MLGRPDAPAFSADAVEVRFDPLSIMPRIVDVRLVHPVIRARLDGLGRVSLPALQNWIDSLSKNAAPRTRWVSDDLPVSLSGLRILLETLGGPLDLSGDARIVRGALVQAALTARPSAMGYNGIAIRLTDARLTFETAIGAYRISARFAGDVKAAGLEAKAMAIRFVSDDVQWDPASKSLATPSARLTLSAQGLEVSGFATKAPAFDAIAEYLRLSFAQSMPAGGLHLRLKGGAGFSPEALLRRFPVLAREKKLAGAIRTNLTRLDVDADVDATLAKDGFGLRSGAPLLLSGARGAVLTVSRMALQKNGGSLSGAAALALHGGGFPEISLDGQGRRAADGSMGGDGTIRVKGDYDMLRGGDLAARGAVTARGGRFAFTAADCARITLAQLRSGTGDLANGISGSVCPSGEAMIVSDAGGWSFNAMARGAAMTLPQAPAVVDKAEAKIAFHGDARDFGGKIAVLAAHVTDKAPALRFHPLDATGDIALNKGIWRGGFAVAGPHNSALGTAHFTHAMASGVGDARINITHLEFAPGKLQPTMLSPLLGAVREVNGVARLDGVRQLAPRCHRQPRHPGHRETGFPHPAGDRPCGKRHHCAEIAAAARDRARPASGHRAHRLDLAVQRRGGGFLSRFRQPASQFHQDRIRRRPGVAGRFQHRSFPPAKHCRHCEARRHRAGAAGHRHQSGQQVEVGGQGDRGMCLFRPGPTASASPRVICNPTAPAACR